MSDADGGVQALDGRELVQRVTEALIRVDAGKLEELAAFCVDLNARKEGKSHLIPLNLARSRRPLEVLERVLAESRANLSVLLQLHLFAVRAESDAVMASDVSRLQTQGGPAGDVVNEAMYGKC